MKYLIPLFCTLLILVGYASYNLGYNNGSDASFNTGYDLGFQYGNLTGYDLGMMMAILRE